MEVVDEEVEEEKNNQEEQQEEQQDKKQKDLIEYQIKDHDNGKYEITYKNSTNCPDLEISVEFMNERDEYEPIRGSPF